MHIYKHVVVAFVDNILAGLAIFPTGFISRPDLPTKGIAVGGSEDLRLNAVLQGLGELK